MHRHCQPDRQSVEHRALDILSPQNISFIPPWQGVETQVPHESFCGMAMISSCSSSVRHPEGLALEFDILDSIREPKVCVWNP